VTIIDTHRRAAALRPHVARERTRVRERPGLEVRWPAAGPFVIRCTSAVDAGDRQRIDERLRARAAPAVAEQLDERVRRAALAARLARADDDGDVAVAQPLAAQPSAHALLRGPQRGSVGRRAADLVGARGQREEDAACSLVVARLVHLAQYFADRRQEIARPARRARSCGGSVAFDDTAAQGASGLCPLVGDHAWRRDRQDRHSTEAGARRGGAT
jgi:hypothetical protein